MRLYLHIGTEKTGTTSIQNFFASNREALARDGILFPIAPGNKNQIGLATWAQKKRSGELWRKLNLESDEDFRQFRERLPYELAEEISETKPATVVLSNEHCSSRLRTPKEVAALHGMLSGLFDDIRVVVYLRRQDEYVRSTYSTHIKTGHSGRLDAPNEDRIARRYDYWELLGRWSRVFGRERMICRKFEKGSLVENDVVRDFLAATHIGLNSAYEFARLANVSLDAKCLEFLRLLNERQPPGTKNRKVVAALETISDGPLLDLAVQDRRRLMEQVKPSNLLVAREYFGGEIAGSGDPLFRDIADGRPRLQQGALEAEDVVQLTARLLAGRPAPGPAQKPPQELAPA